jgi:hypothetical protein
MRRSLLEIIKIVWRDYDNLTPKSFVKLYGKKVLDFFIDAEELSRNMVQKDNRLSRTNVVYLTLTTNKGEK